MTKKIKRIYKEQVRHAHAMAHRDIWSIEACEKRHVLWVFLMCDLDKEATARKLGVHINTVYNKLRKWGLFE